jgi:hypothetical protein
MARLGYILMTMFEMQASHLYAFEIPPGEDLSEHIREIRERIPDKEKAEKTVNSFMVEFNKIYRFEIPDEENFATHNDRYVTFDSADSKLSRVISTPKARLNFNYDFGDDWWISLTLESVTVDRELPGKELPQVLEGAGYGIIEDCGGASGLEELAQAFKKKKGRTYKEFSEWLGIDDLDMSAFDIDDMNFRLKKVPRIYADIYERHLEPTKRSIDLLERKYLKK